MMAVQYKDGTFGETKEFDEAFSEFMTAVDADIAKAFFVGTKEEIDKIKERESLQEQVDKLSKELKTMKAKNSKIIKQPTYEEICEVARQIARNGG